METSYGEVENINVWLETNALKCEENLGNGCS